MTGFNIVHSVYLFYVIWTDMSENKLFVIVIVITYPQCTACYVGQSSRHLQTRFREHTRNPGPVKTHLSKCNTTVTEEHIDILASTSRGEGYLLTPGALFIQELEPKINT